MIQQRNEYANERQNTSTPSGTHVYRPQSKWSTKRVLAVDEFMKANCKQSSSGRPLSWPRAWLHRTEIQKAVSVHVFCIQTPVILIKITRLYPVLWSSDTAFFERQRHRMWRLLFLVSLVRYKGLQAIRRHTTATRKQQSCRGRCIRFLHCTCYH